MKQFLHDSTFLISIIYIFELLVLKFRRAWYSVHSHRRVPISSLEINADAEDGRESVCHCEGRSETSAYAEWKTLSDTARDSSPGI